MQIVSRYPDGVFCWVDLSTSDVEGAKSFYGSLFGWTFTDIPAGDSIVYSMGFLEGNTVAGVGPQDPQMGDAPPFWSAYIKHDDVDAVAAKVTENGGTVMFPPMDVFDSGRMTMIQDPTGAMAGIWQPKEHIGAQLVNVPNTLTWTELQTRDESAAKKFYSAIFDWTYEVDNTGYSVVQQEGRTHAGMMKIQESWGDVPPNWSIYFLVEDAEAAAALAQELGGKLLSPVAPAGDIGKFAIIVDPQGAHFNIIEYAGPASPPPGY